jgi:hypothetical protein
LPEKFMQKIAAFLVAGVFSTAAFAGANCAKHPKSEWMPEADAKARSRNRATTSRSSRWTAIATRSTARPRMAEGEIYFDTKTLEIVKSEIGS